MYSKEQASKLKEAFWTTFGQYIAPHPSAEGLKINWINYKTGIRYLHFKMQADHRSASIAVELSHSDPGIQELIFEQFREFTKILSSYLHEEWEWQLHTTDENHRTISRIYKTLEGVSIFKEEDWPAMISFFKPRIIALDDFWNDASHSFDLFR
ncbi:protein of unknown function [Pedobacter westerhofensis]|uniref:DUF4268 domain-containing protein n=1 Tax=Pedobacter westerhofensis TaxID=425512 RepID=A0A521FE31_9SPHI|nr:DUF4268 domain-containing protein [Pedobacter westerhofensis]SMO93800.1 protein of unknown function [Pedobacter westerhofensis]